MNRAYLYIHDGHKELFKFFRDRVILCFSLSLMYTHTHSPALERTRDEEYPNDVEWCRVLLHRTRPPILFTDRARPVRVATFVSDTRRRRRRIGQRRGIIVRASVGGKRRRHELEAARRAFFASGQCRGKRNHGVRHATTGTIRRTIYALSIPYGFAIFARIRGKLPSPSIWLALKMIYGRVRTRPPIRYACARRRRVVSDRRTF